MSYVDRILTILGSHCFSRLLLRSLSECPANRNIIFRLYRFSFSLTYKILTCGRTLISALQALGKHHRICGTTSVKLRFNAIIPLFHQPFIYHFIRCLRINVNPCLIFTILSYFMCRFLLSDDFYVLKLSFYTIGFTGTGLCFAV